MGFIFLISGLGLTVSSMKKKIVLSKFYKRRFVRIYPLYVFALILYIFFIAKIDLFNLVIHALNLHNFFDEYCHNPKPLWFMGIIFQFYLIFPFLFKIFNKYKFKTIFIITVIAYSLFSFYALYFEYSSDKPLYIASNLQDVLFLFFSVQFIFGMYLGRLMFQNDVKRFNELIRWGKITLVYLIIFTLLILVLFTEKELYYLFKFFSPIYSFAITAVVLSFIQKYISGRIIQLLSKYSIGVFSVYIFHEFVLSSFAYFYESFIFGIFVAIPGTLLICYYIQKGYDHILKKAKLL